MNFTKTNPFPQDRPQPPSYKTGLSHFQTTLPPPGYTTGPDSPPPGYTTDPNSPPPGYETALSPSQNALSPSQNTPPPSPDTHPRSKYISPNSEELYCGLTEISLIKCLKNGRVTVTNDRSLNVIPIPIPNPNPNPNPNPPPLVKNS
jgi:hypothetical protein